MSRLYFGFDDEHLPGNVDDRDEWLIWETSDDPKIVTQTWIDGSIADPFRIDVGRGSLLDESFEMTIRIGVALVQEDLIDAFLPARRRRCPLLLKRLLHPLSEDEIKDENESRSDFLQLVQSETPAHLPGIEWTWPYNAPITVKRDGEFALIVSTRCIRKKPEGAEEK
jgi:hypothetical protein